MQTMRSIVITKQQQQQQQQQQQICFHNNNPIICIVVFFFLINCIITVHSDEITSSTKKSNLQSSQQSSSSSSILSVPNFQKPTRTTNNNYGTTTITSIDLNNDNDNNKNVARINSSSSSSSNRQLAIGDFDRFNRLFENATIDLPDATIGNDLVTITVSDLVCRNFYIGDVDFNYRILNETSKQTLVYDIYATPFSMICTATYTYVAGFIFRGEGVLEASTSNNVAQTSIRLQSNTTFNIQPPSTVNIDYCSANINVTTISFKGGIVADILNIFEDLVAQVVADQAEKAACDELSTLGPTLFNNLLNTTTYRINEWIEPIPTDLADPLFVESNYSKPDGVTLINFQNTDNGNTTTVSSVLINTLTKSDTLFGEPIIIDPSNPNITELAINQFLRDNFLNDDGVFIIEFDDDKYNMEFNNTSDDFDPILFSGHDQLTETYVRINSMSATGLDTLTTFSTFQNIGEYTIRNEMKWDGILSIALNLTIDTKPSSLPDSILKNPTPIHFIENITLTLDLSKVDINASIFMAVNEDKFNALQIGSLLVSPLSCLLSTIEHVEVSGMEINIDKINEPILDGFISPGIGRLSKTFIEGIFHAFAPTIKRAMPHFFQGPARNVINKRLLDRLITNADAETTTCQKPNIDNEYVDFRDLFLDPDEAIALGGSGNSPYGTLSPTVLDLVQDRLLDINSEDDLPGINSILVRPFTERQSGINGTLVFFKEGIALTSSNNETLPDDDTSVSQGGLNSIFQNNFDFNLSNIRLSNLDTVTAPLELLMPTNLANVLANKAKLGVSGRPVTLTIQLLTDFFDSRNEIDVSATFGQIEIQGNVSALVDVEKFLQYPLEDVFTLDCWLYALAQVDLDSEGQAIDIFAARGISLVDLEMNLLSTMNITTSCLNCTTPGAALLGSVIGTITRSGAFGTLSNRIPTLLKSLSTSSSVQTFLDRWTSESKKFCPSSPDYQENAIRVDYGYFPFPVLSAESIDTVLYSGALVAAAALVTFSETQRLRGFEEGDPLSAQKSFVPPEGVRLLDWTNIGNSTGLGSVVDQILNQTDQLLGSSEGFLDLNATLFELVGEDGVVEIGTGFEYIRDGFSISLNAIRIGGLHDFGTIGTFEPIAEQTLRATAQIGSLQIEFLVSADEASTEDPPQNIVFRIPFEDVSLDVAIFAAFDVDKIASLQIGSILDQSRIVPCILSTALAFEITDISVAVGFISFPELSGLFADTTASVNAAISSLLSHYRDTIESGIPRIVDGAFKQIFNNITSDFSLNSEKCLPLVVNDSFVDFRDLFLTSDEALSKGGSGSLQYGNLGSKIFNTVQESFREIGDDGLPRINELLVRPFTKIQSGMDGHLRFPDELVSFGGDRRSEISGRRMNGLFSTFFEQFQFALSDIRILNLDTVGLPLSIIEPTNQSNVLQNELILGAATDRSLKMTARVTAGLFAGMNEVDVSMLFNSIDFLASVLALIKTDSFFLMHLSDVLDFNCWLAILPKVELDDNGLPVNSTSIRGLVMEYFAASVSPFSIDTECIQCDSEGLELLPELLQLSESSGAFEVLRLRAPAVLKAITESDTVQVFFDRWVNDAAKFCPSRPEYSPNATRTEFGSIAFPSLPALSIDTLLFLGVLASQVAFVVFSETQRFEYVPSDPLSVQRTFVAPDDVHLLDWTNFGNGTSLGGIADVFLSEARDLLADVKDSIFDVSNVFGGLLDDNGLLDVDIQFGFSQENIAFQVQSVRFSGLDSFELNEVLTPLGPQTIANEIAFPALSFEFIFGAESPGFMDLPQTITMQFSVQNVTANIVTFAAFDLDKIGALNIGFMNDMKSLFQCILSTNYAFEIPQLDVSIDSFSSPEVLGLMAETQEVTHRLTQAIFQRFRPTIGDAIPILFDSVGKEFATDLLQNFGNDGRCESVDIAANVSSFLDFRDLFLSSDEALFRGASGESPYGTLISIVYELIQDEYLEPDSSTGLLPINSKLIADVAEAQSGIKGRLYFPGDVLNQDSKVRAGTLKALLKVRLHDVYINNLDTFGAPFVFLDPVAGEAHMLNNSGSVGVGRPLEIGASLYFSLSNEDVEIENDIEISMGMDDLSVLLVALLKMESSSFRRIPLRDLTNLWCWLATIPAPVLDERGVIVDSEDRMIDLIDFMASVSHIGLNVSCVQCSGPQFKELSELFSSLGASEAITDLANSLFDALRSLLDGNFFRVTVDRALNNAKKMCPHSKSYDPDFVKSDYEPFDTESNKETVLTFFVTLAVVVAVIFVVVMIVILTTRLIVRRRYKQWVSSLQTNQLLRLKRQQHKEDNTQDEVNNFTSSMFQSKHVPLSLRLFMPVVILGNIALFLSGHLSLGASVTLLGKVGGQKFEANDFFKFSMAQSTIEIWKAGARELAIIIFLFSFIWPYSKQILTMWLWFAPPSLCTVKRRGSLFFWLDALAKWSMIDVFVLIITIVSFRVSIRSPDLTYLPEDLYSIDLLVVPKWGLYANMTAQIVSQLSSHVIVHYHRRIVYLAAPHLNPARTGSDLPSTSVNPVIQLNNKSRNNETQKYRLFAHAYVRPHRGSSDKLVIRTYVNPLLLFASSVVCVLVVVGCIFPSFSLSVVGLVGVLVESGQAFNDASTKFSVFSVLGILFDQAKLTGMSGDYVGLGSLSCLLFLSVFVVPVLQTFVLLVQWFQPLLMKRRFRISIMLEILQSWQYAEVYLLSVLVGSWQIGPISEFMINPYCASLESYLSELAYYGILKREDAQCYRANVNVEPTFYLLFSAAVVLAVVNTFVMKAVTQFFIDMDPEQNPFSSSDDDLEAGDDDDNVDIMHDDDEIDEERLRIPPVLFSDQFRWFLRREDNISQPNDYDEASDPHYSEPDILPTPLPSSNKFEMSEDESIYYDDRGENRSLSYHIAVDASTPSFNTGNFDPYANDGASSADKSSEEKTDIVTSLSGISDGSTTDFVSLRVGNKKPYGEDGSYCEYCSAENRVGNRRPYDEDGSYCEYCSKDNQLAEKLVDDESDTSGVSQSQQWSKIENRDRMVDDWSTRSVGTKNGVASINDVSMDEGKSLQPSLYSAVANESNQVDGKAKTSQLSTDNPILPATSTDEYVATTSPCGGFNFFEDYQDDKTNDPNDKQHNEAPIYGVSIFTDNFPEATNNTADNDDNDDTLYNSPSADSGDVVSLAACSYDEGIFGDNTTVPKSPMSATNSVKSRTRISEAQISPPRSSVKQVEDLTSIINNEPSFTNDESSMSPHSTVKK